MSIIEDSNTAGLIARVKAILLTPKAEWDVIDAEPATIKGIYCSYVIPLAAITPVCQAIGLLVFGYGGFGLSFKPSLLSAVVQAVLLYVMSLVGAYVVAWVIDALAPSFGGTKDRLKAFKVVAYGSTAAWVTGVFFLMPTIGFLSAFGLYSLYLYYLGLPKLMKTTEDKAVPYAAAVVVLAIVVQVVIFAVPSAIIAATLGHSGGVFAHQDGSLTGKVKIGGTEVDLAKLQAASQQLEAQSKAMEAQAKGDAAGAAAAGAVQAVPGETLKALLPSAVAGFNRTEVQSSAAGVAGMQGSNAEGTYTRGSDQLNLSVTDMAAMGGLAGLAGAINVNSSKETATGYEKVGNVDGRMTTEEYDRSSKSGKYGVMVANRFMVEAHGSNVSMDELKAAVGSVGFDKLESLVKG